MMVDFILILAIISGGLFFYRSWFVTKKSRALSLLILIGTIAMHPKVTYFLAQSDGITISIAVGVFTLILSLFILNPLYPASDRMTTRLLFTTVLYATVLCTLTTLRFYLGYYDSSIIMGTALSYVPVVAFIGYRTYSVDKTAN